MNVGPIYLILLIIFLVVSARYVLRPKKSDTQVTSNTLVSLAERTGSPATNTRVRKITVTPLPDGSKKVDLSQTETIEAQKTFYIS